MGYDLSKKPNYWSTDKTMRRFQRLEQKHALLLRRIEKLENLIDKKLGVDCEMLMRDAKS